MKKTLAPYLRALAGMVGAICLWLTFVAVVSGNVGQAALQLLFAVGLGYLAVGKPIREHRARVKAEHDALLARADVGNAAFLAGDPAAFAPPPEPPAKPPVRRGVVIAAIIAAVLVLIGIIADVSDGLDYPSGTSTTQTPP